MSWVLRTTRGGRGDTMARDRGRAWKGIVDNGRTYTWYVQHDPKAPSSRGAVTPVSVCVTLTPCVLLDLESPPLSAGYQDHRHSKLQHQGSNVLVHHTLHATPCTAIKIIKLDEYFLLKQRRINNRSILSSHGSNSPPPPPTTNNPRFQKKKP